MTLRLTIPPVSVPLLTLFVGVFLFLPLNALGAVVGYVGDIDNASATPSPVLGETPQESPFYTDGPPYPDPYLIAGVKFYGMAKTGSVSGDGTIRMRIRNNTSGSFIDCQSEWFVPSVRLPVYSGGGTPSAAHVAANGAVLTLEFTGSQCSLSASTHNYFMYGEKNDALGSQSYTDGLWTLRDSGTRFIMEISDTPYPPPTPPDVTTRIDSVEPYDGETVATTTPTTYGMEGYIATDDYKEGARVRLKLDRNTDQQAVGALIAWESATGNYTDFELTSDGAISISTTTVEQLLGVEREGEWHMRWEIQSPRFSVFGFTFFNETLVATSTTYIYGQPTGIDIVQQTQEDILQGIIDSATDPLSNCQFDFSSILDFSATDNIYTCVVTMVSSMIIPNSQQAQLLVQGAKDSFLDKAPWGYATRVYEILSTDTSTTTLPSIAFTVPDGLPGDEHVAIDFSPWEPIAGAITRIDTTEVETIDGSPLDMFLHWWNILWLIMFALWLIRELHGAWEAGDFEHDGHSSGAMDKGIYAYRGLVQTRTKMDRESLRSTQRDIIRRSRR